MNDRILQLIAEIDEFKGYWRGIGALPDTSLESLRRFATIESIGSSTRIEGAKLSDDEVAALLVGIDVRSFRTRDEQEVAGYAEAMRIIYDSWEYMDVTESMTRSLHKTLMQYSEKDAWHRGDYKKHPNHVAAFDDHGNEIGVVFETTSPFDTPMAMEKLVSKTQKDLVNRSRHPLLVIGNFVLRFLAIHPFQDGNGRLSRVLTTLLLLKAGYDYAPFSSLERLVEANKSRYYQALRVSQVALDKTDVNATPWLEFFLEMLKRQTELLLEVMERERRVTQLSPPLQGIITLAQQRGRVSVADVAAVQNVSRNTAKKRIQKLVEEEKLKLVGKGRGAYYRVM